MKRLYINNSIGWFVYFLMSLCFLFIFVTVVHAVPDTFFTENVPFDMPTISNPEIPNQTFNITDFGAIDDGKTSNSKAFENAINSCKNAGGGKILVPAGIWLTGPINFISNMELHLEKGAILLFSPDFEEYPLVHSSFEGTEQVRSASPINAVNVENIAITGEGLIDGSGEAWRPVKRFKMTNRQWNGLLESGGVVDENGSIWWPTKAALDGAEYIQSLQNKESVTLKDYEPARDFLRPVMVRLTQCKNVLLDGPTFQNSPAWNIHPLMCENLVIRNITVRNPWFSQNGDGLDLESCKNVYVYDCRFDVGDDAICIKSGRDEYGRKRGIPSENIVIYNCIVYHGHGGVTIGSEMSGGVENIWASDCTFLGTDVGLRFKSTRGRGGIVENLYFQNIQMIDIPYEAILFDLFYNSEGEAEALPQVDEGTPRFQKIYFENIKSLNASTSIFIRGLPELYIKDIYFNNLMMSSANGIACIYTENIEFNNINLTVEENPPIEIHQSKDIDFESVDFVYPQGSLIKVEGKESENIRIKDSELVKKKPVIDYAPGIGENTVSILPE